MAPKSIAITINVGEAYRNFARALGDATGKLWLVWLDAYRWFYLGGQLRRFWRHGVYRRLWPCRYDERRLQAEDAERRMKQALIAAVFDRFGKVPFRRQNWRYN